MSEQSMDPHEVLYQRNMAAKAEQQKLAKLEQRENQIGRNALNYLEKRVMGVQYNQESEDGKRVKVDGKKAASIRKRLSRLMQSSFEQDLDNEKDLPTGELRDLTEFQNLDRALNDSLKAPVVKDVINGTIDPAKKARFNALRIVHLSMNPDSKFYVGNPQEVNQMTPEDRTKHSQKQKAFDSILNGVPEARLHDFLAEEEDRIDNLQQASV